MDIILVGAGRYGNGLIGKKHLNKTYGANLSAVVDPNIKEISKKHNYHLENTPKYDSFEKVARNVKPDTVVELAIVPKALPEAFYKIAMADAKNVILPKPVVTNREALDEIYDIGKKKNMKLAVTSNWHYSEITGLTKAVLDKIKGKKFSTPEKIKTKYDDEIASIPSGLKILKAEIEYNKKHETLATEPPLQEMPHALQILYSTGLTDFKGVTMMMEKSKQSKSAVNVVFDDVKGVEDTIYVNSDLRKENMEFPRERILKVYLNDDDEAPDIVTNYNALFDEDGNCLKRAYVKVDINKNGQKTRWKQIIKEDNLDSMYREIFKYFKGEKNHALTLKEYKPVAEKICEVHEMWKKCTEEKEQ